MQAARIVGNNCKLQLMKDNISKQQFADALGYSEYDIDKLCDGRLFTTEEDIEDIAKFFGIDTQKLYEELDAKEYVGDDFIHCMGQFKSISNREKILDILDMYCDLKEALNE